MHTLSTQGTKVTWKMVNGELKPFAGGTEIIWAAQPGSQIAFLSCPVFECLLTGNRGGGKTDALLMDYLQHVGQGFKNQWRGILFRRTFPELDDVVAKSRNWFKKIFPNAEFNQQKYTWTFPEGEQLMFRHFQVDSDYDHYHGHAYPWIAFEELSTWPTPNPYKAMMSCSRSSDPRMPRKYRSTTNPYGVGHTWVKRRFYLPLPPKTLLMNCPLEHDENGKAMPSRAVIISSLSENKVLLTADPHYQQKIRAAAKNPAQLAAWLNNDWDVVSGGMFDDVWFPDVHVLPDLFGNQIPARWKIFRAYDHGQSAPFSVGWYCISNGEPITIQNRVIGRMKGDIIRFGEWYGCRPGTDNEGLRMSPIDIALGIVKYEFDHGLTGRVRSGTADDAIFDDYTPGRSVAGDMERAGIRWIRAGKGQGSRIQGWQQVRQYLKNAIIPLQGTREYPGFFVCSRCYQFLRTFPILPRDETNPDDVNTKSEDHIGDEVRYALKRKDQEMTSGGF